MKVYLNTERTDWSLRRIVDALERYKPDGVQLVDDPRDAELVVLHVIGRNERTRKSAQRLLANGQQYACIQYSLRKTRNPHTSDWLPLWRGAVLTWSYYDLEAWCKEDWTPFDFNFYHAPLGVDTEVFWPRKRQRQFLIATSGPSAVTDTVREAAFAARRVGGTMLHFGPELKRGPNVICKANLSDDMVACLLSECQFVAGLRRVEGFELMAAEGLMCGARPICYDQDHYRQWYGDAAVYIPEGSRDEAVDSLEAVFREGAKPVTEEERKEAAALFDWKQSVMGFWDGCLHG